MNENDEIKTMDTEFESHRQLLVKWLGILLWVQIVGLVASALSSVPNFGALATWFGYGVTAGAAVCLFQMTSTDTQYLKAAFFLIATLGCRLINLLLGDLIALLQIPNSVGSIITFVASICSIVAVYQEYTAHAGLVAEQDDKLSDNWKRLFGLQMLVAVVKVIGLNTATMLTVFLSVDTLVLRSVVTAVLEAAQTVLNVLYLVYLHRTWKLFQ